MRLVPTGGAYKAASLIANAQECINLYTEMNPEKNNPPVPVTHYVKPGLRLLQTPPTFGNGRGIYRASNGDGYCVIGQIVYYINQSFNLTAVGAITSTKSIVYFRDNGVTIVLVDGSTNGYSIDMQSRNFNPIIDAAFYGADRVDVLDGFLIFNRPNTAQFYITDPFALTFNPLNIASKADYPDNIVTLAVVHRELWLLGALKSAVWYPSGAADFYFQEVPGALIEHGCAARYSVVTTDTAVFWLGRDLDGHAVMFRGQNYMAKRISNHAIEAEWQTYPMVDDAIAYSYQQGGHVFVVMSFPAANKTWAYDLSTDQWARRAYADLNGNLNRDRSQLHAFIYDTSVTLDWQTGAIYALDPQTYTDNGNPIVCIRSFPTLVDNDMARRMSYNRVMLDVETGTQPGTTSEISLASSWNSGFSSGFGPITENDPPYIFMRFSDDGGHTWSNKIRQQFGAAGQYNKFPLWQRLGYGRRRVFEFSWAQPMKTALNACYVDAEPHDT